MLAKLLHEWQTCFPFSPYLFGVRRGFYFAEDNCKTMCLRDTFELSALDCICSLHMLGISICWKMKVLRILFEKLCSNL